MEEPKTLYKKYVEGLTIVFDEVKNLAKRHVSFRKECENHFFKRLFHLRYLKKLDEALQDVYSSYRKLHSRWECLSGVVSTAYQAEESHINKTFVDTFGEMDSLKQKLHEVDELLQKCE